MRRSLKTTRTWMTVGAAAVGLVGLATALAITSVMNVLTADLSGAVESLRATDEVEVQLLLHNESRSPMTKGASKAGLLRALDETEKFIQSDEERRRVAELRKAVEAYLRPGGGETEVGAALSAARGLALLNVDQARHTRQRAELWDRLCNVGGIAAAVVLLLGVVAFVTWLRHGALRQIADLSRAMEEFSAGNLDSRAPETGPRELVVMARSFNAASGALIRARHRQAEFVATAIHDLRTPLTSIQLAVGYVIPDRPLPPEPRIRALVELVQRQLTRINGLVGDVLNATWTEAGELRLLEERVDLRLLAASSVAQFRALAPQHLIELATPPEPLMVEGDRARLEQVLNNLVSNAIKYSPFGSRVWIAVERVGSEVVMSVRDEGPGIAPEDRERIFEPYQRRSATHGEVAGTSLGLWVSQRVVEAHGGRIEVESRVGQGSTFRIILPAGPAPAAHHEEEAAAPPDGT